jgi:SAM-dependent methyltransferase
VTGGFEAEWLAARRPYDDAALDPLAVAAIRVWAATLPDGPPVVVVDLGSGTGAALRRVAGWLAPRPIRAYAVDHDAELLERAGTAMACQEMVTLVGDLLVPLDALAGPPDGTVDLVVGHALADLVPLDRLAARSAALARPGGLIHLVLAYDGLTAFGPSVDPALEAAVLAAFHRHMDRAATRTPSYGGSTAGRRLGPALAAAGLTVLVDAPSTWDVRADDGAGGRRVLDRLIRYVVDAARAVGGVAPRDLSRWESARRAALDDGRLSVRVGHRDVLAQAADRGE